MNLKFLHFVGKNLPQNILFLSIEFLALRSPLAIAPLSPGQEYLTDLCFFFVTESEENNEIKETRGSAAFIMNLSRRERTAFGNISVLYNSNFTKENSSNQKMEKADLLPSYTEKENTSAQNINRRKVDNVTNPSNINEVLQYRVNPVLEQESSFLKKRKAMRSQNVERSAPGIPNFLYPAIPTPGD